MRIESLIYTHTHTHYRHQHTHTHTHALLYLHTSVHIDTHAYITATWLYASSAIILSLTRFSWAFLPYSGFVGSIKPLNTPCFCTFITQDGNENNQCLSQEKPWSMWLCVCVCVCAFILFFSRLTEGSLGLSMLVLPRVIYTITERRRHASTAAALWCMESLGIRRPLTERARVCMAEVLLYASAPRCNNANCSISGKSLMSSISSRRHHHHLPLFLLPAVRPYPANDAVLRYLSSALLMPGDCTLLSGVSIEKGSSTPYDRLTASGGVSV